MFFVMFHHYQSLLYLQCLSEKKSVQTFIKEKNYGIACIIFQIFLKKWLVCYDHFLQAFTLYCNLFVLLLLKVLLGSLLH